MRTINIKLKIPDWIPTKYDLYSLKKLIQFKLNPPKCIKCNTTLKMNGFYYGIMKKGKYHGLDNIEQTFAVKSEHQWCKSCMKKYIHSVEKNVGDCTTCNNKNVEVFGYYYGKKDKVIITFLWGYWNNGQYCMTCIDDLIDNGRKRTDTYRIKNDKSIPIFY